MTISFFYFPFLLLVPTEFHIDDDHGEFHSFRKTKHGQDQEQEEKEEDIRQIISKDINLYFLFLVLQISVSSMYLGRWSSTQHQLSYNGQIKDDTDKQDEEIAILQISFPSIPS